MNFERIKRNYDDGLWSIEMVKVAVEKGVITETQFLEITSEVFEEQVVI